MHLKLLKKFLIVLKNQKKLKLQQIHWELKAIQKTAEATGHLIGNKIANKVTGQGLSTIQTENTAKMQTPLEKKQQIVDELRLILYIYIYIYIYIILNNK